LIGIFGMSAKGQKRISFLVGTKTLATQMSALGLGRVKTFQKERRFWSPLRAGCSAFFDLCPDRCHERLDAHDVQYAGEVIGQDM
jgi:hypothetical protein